MRVENAGNCPPGFTEIGAYQSAINNYRFGDYTIAKERGHPQAYECQNMRLRRLICRSKCSPCASTPVADESILIVCLHTNLITVHFVDIELSYHNWSNKTSQFCFAFNSSHFGAVGLSGSRMPSMACAGSEEDLHSTVCSCFVLRTHVNVSTLGAAHALRSKLSSGLDAFSLVTALLSQNDDLGSDDESPPR